MFQALRVQTQLEADDYEVWCSVQDADDDVDSQPLLSQQSSGASENNILDRSFADSHGLYSTRHVFFAESRCVLAHIVSFADSHGL